jgi:predicted SprT family Zn-dependent metalloprotease
MNLPKALEPVRVELIRALTGPVLASWPEESSFELCPVGERIAAIIGPVLHEDLAKARIAFLFKKEIKDKAGTAAKAGGKLQFLTSYDYTIEINWTAWRQMTAEQRVALIDHELTHCVYDHEKQKWVLREHDIEEFREIVDRWGLWHPALKTFGESVQSAQTTLFEVAT